MSNLDRGNENTIVAIIVSYNPPPKVVSLCQSLLAQVSRIVVVDNGSHMDNENLLALRNINKLDLVLLGRNLGIGFALNVGVRRVMPECNPEFILFLDQDSVLPDGSLYLALSLLRRDERVGLVHLSEGLGPAEAEFKDFAITSGSVVRSGIAKEIWFREEFFMDQIDHDYCYNLRLKGYKVAEISAGATYSIGQTKSLADVPRPRKMLWLALARVSRRPHGQQIRFEPGFRVHYVTRNSLILLKERKINIRFFLWQLLDMLIRLYIANGVRSLVYPTAVGFVDGLVGKTGRDERFLP
ncbi:MAG: glycosyltransferase [Nitrososphaerota archaeon]|nr:glycosyltransferase [Nitrososphaerota archaeon]